jgi:hypothetical protein
MVQCRLAKKKSPRSKTLPSQGEYNHDNIVEVLSLIQLQFHQMPRPPIIQASHEKKTLRTRNSLASIAMVINDENSR